MKKEKLKKLTLIALLSAVAYILMLIQIPVPLMPPFIKLDFSELPCIAASFMLNPLSGVVVCLVKNVLHGLTITNTFWVGELANFLIGASFTLTAGIIYKKKKTFAGSMIACAAGIIIAAVIGFFVNYYIIYPVYAKVTPMEEILQFYMEVLPFADTLGKALFIFNTPFTLVKFLIVSILNLICYGKLETLYKK